MKNFKNFILENKEYIHKNFTHSDNIIDPLEDGLLKDYLYPSFMNITDKDRKILNSYLKRNKQNSIVLYHGTSPRNNILSDGLLKTTTKRRLSYQSTSGFVYLAIFPDMAKMYSDVGYGISNSVVYKVIVPIEYIKPDTDNLYNKRMYSPTLDVQDTLADSLFYANTFKVKGNIPPYMISIHT